MEKDFLDELLSLLASTGVTSEQYMIEHSLFFDKTVVDKAFDEMLDNLKNNQPIPVRKSTKAGMVYQKGQQHLWKSIYQNVPDFEVKIDSDGNREVRGLINRFTGITISQGANSSIMFGKISHIWGEAINPLFFTALWNIVIVPAYLNDVLDKNDGTHPFVSRIKEIYKAICWEKYDVESKLKKLGLTQQEVDQYAPDITVLNGLSFSINVVPMKPSKKVPKVPKRPTGPTGGTGIGKYARQTITDLLKTKQLTSTEITHLEDPVFCKNKLGMNYPVLVDVTKSGYNTDRYYKQDRSIAPYVICNDWYERNRPRFDAWLKTI